MLCKFCLNICAQYHSITLPTLKAIPPKPIPHYSDLRDWVKSGSDGCEMCRLFTESIPADLQSVYTHHQNEPSEDLRAIATAPSSDSKPNPETFHPVALRPYKILGYDMKTNRYRVLELRGLGWTVVGIFCTKKDDFAAQQEADIIHRIVDDDPASKGSLELIHEWIRDCNDSHENCRQTNLPYLPTRVLDLGVDETLEMRLFTTNQIRDRYATFSHRWGGDIPRRTTADCFENYCLSIPLHTLPQSFKDAARITKRLGIQYLWIDALCIIQDSKDDWEKECKNMCNIYRDSYITIAAPNASSAGAGFLQRRRLPTIKPIRLPYYNLDSTIAGEMWFQVKEEDTEFGPDWDSLLRKRGWVLQEQVLSRRTIYFGTKQNYFECFETTHLEATGLWGETPRESRPNLVLLSDSDPKNCHYEWSKIVRDYSRRTLTYPKDKFPALSGLAKDFGSKSGCHYLAGHWRENLIPTLGWRICPPAVPRSTDEYRAPSWSWASVDKPIEFVGSHSIKSWEAELLGDSIILGGSDPFGEVSDGFITVRARLKDAEIRFTNAPLLRTGIQPHWNSQVRNTTEMSWFLVDISKKEPMNRLGYCYFDYDPTQTSVEQVQTVHCMQLARLNVHLVHAPYPASAALLLRRADRGSKVQYKRVGYVELSKRYFDGAEEYPMSSDGKSVDCGKEWFDDAIIQEIVLL